MTINIKIIMIIIKKMKMKIMTNITTTNPVARLTASQWEGGEHEYFGEYSSGVRVAGGEHEYFAE
jgi:hypothetical protein